MRRYVTVDCFTKTRLHGNPVAVFDDADGMSPGLMQRVAREMNLSETTFVTRRPQRGEFSVRIFTPVNELAFAGHPLLGTALALAAEAEGGELGLHTQMGRVPVRLSDDDSCARMTQPTPTVKTFDRSEDLLVALGVREATMPLEIYHNGPRHVLVGLASIAELASLRPDHRALGAFEDMAVNCFAGSGTQWRNRMFSPAYGVVEDAATGSAAGPIAIHLARHGAATLGTPLRITQGVEMGRPSDMYACVSQDHDGGARAVQVWGHGILCAEGRMHV
ncbi:PhzF family phenazine biosynthesis protein [Flexivirga sp. ID2601S]|uniref:PhzF family phenazine biosynthesis protein n=1 Tax=Flexivirga aerilata TaxID=1656889 RepID=A0A849AJH7_9MICO|nr:PhzF family phenazine biosynthesis protein [Flexivirga aerilata]NNG39408.1 PhzF family phenazine biosynthesis protein [Flexivirga aerilata]